MSNYALAFGNGAGSNASAITPYTGQLAIENATAIGFTARIKGSFINENRILNNSGVLELAAGKIAFCIVSTGGNVALRMEPSGLTAQQSGNLATSSIDPAKWYLVRMWWDTAAATKQKMELIREVDGVVLLSATGADTNALPVFAGFGNLAFNYRGGTAGTLLEVDWLAVWDSAAHIPTGTPAEPLTTDTGVVSLNHFDENTGTTTTDAKNGWVATITGTFSWDLLTIAPVASVTLTYPVSTLNRGATATPTVVLRDASNNVLNNSNYTLAFSTSDATKISINATTGVITAVRGVASGVVTLTCTVDSISGTTTAVGVHTPAFNGLVRYRPSRVYSLSPVELPFLAPDTDYVVKNAGDVTHSPADGAALQTVLTSIAGTSGTVVIKLTAGTRYTGNFIFPARSGPTYIYSSKMIDGTLPASVTPSVYHIGGTQTQGGRIGHQHSYATLGASSPLAQIATNNYLPAISFAAGAGSGGVIRFEGVDVIQDEAITTIIESGLVNTGGPNDTYFTAFADVPRQIHFGHFLIHGKDAQAIRRGVLQNGYYVGFRDGSIYGIHKSGTESAAIGGWNSPGVASHINLLVSGGAQDILYGGAGPSIPNIIPRNFTTKWCHMWKDPAKFTFNSGGVAPNYGWKNHYEHKNGTHILVEDCVLHHLTGDGQNGSNILFQTLNDSNLTPALQRITDITMRRLHIEGGGPMFALIGRAGYSLGGEPIVMPEVPTARILIEHVYGKNVCGTLTESYNASGSAPAGWLFQLTAGLTDLTVRHVTAEGRDAAILLSQALGVSGEKLTRTNFKDNLIGRGHNGSIFDADGNGQGNIAIAHDIASPNFQNNVFFGNQVEGGDSAANYPSGNFYPADPTGVGFSSYTYQNPGALSAGSAYHNAATDGTDIGADTATIATMAAAVKTPDANLPTGTL